MNLVLLLLLNFLADAAGDSTIAFENAYVRVVRVHYEAHEKTGLHDHPALPTVYMYTTDGGRLKIGHDDAEAPITRPAVKAGGIRFQKGVAERHTVEEIDGVESEYLRVELKTKPLDLPVRDVRRAPDDRIPYESEMIRILRVTCAPYTACPASAHPESPAVVVTGRKATWVEPNAKPEINSSEKELEQVRVELKTAP